MSERKDWQPIVAEIAGQLLPAHLLERAGELDARLIEDLGLDSLDLVEIAMEIEKHLGISVSDEDTDLWFTIGDIVRFCERARR